MTRPLTAIALVLTVAVCPGQSIPTRLPAIATGAGLTVKIGCGQPETVNALSQSGGVLHLLDTDRNAVDAARRRCATVGIAGAASADVFDGAALPYVADLVNTLIIDGTDPGCRLSAAEIRRALAPRGILLTTPGAAVPGLPSEERDGWMLYREPVPAEIDDWTHFLHDPQGSSVSNDMLAGPPRGLRWVGGPFWARSHEHTAGMNAMVSAQGRVFYVMDEGPVESIQLPADNRLVARDAFNGSVLWKRPLPHWWNHLYPLKSGPTWLPRRLVAVGDRVYVSPGTGQDLLCLDATTGREVRRYEATATPFEFLVSDGVIIVAVDPDRAACDYQQEHADCWKERNRASTKWQWTPETGARVLKAIRADSGELLWETSVPVTPMSLTANDAMVCFHDGGAMVALDRHTGTQLWRTQVAAMGRAQTGYGGPRVVIHRDKVLFAPIGKMFALSATTGDLLWTVQKKPRSGHFSLEDFYAIDDTIWVLQRSNKGAFSTYSLADGSKLTDHVNPIQSFYIHQRCYPGRATPKYQLPPVMGIQVYDMANDTWANNHWVRGGCIYGIMPANGLVYTPPHACACYYQSKLNGFNAIAPVAESSEAAPGNQRLIKGAAYSRARPDANPGDADWPAFRHDNRRSGYVRTNVPPTPALTWRLNLGTKLSQAVCTGGTVFVSAVDRHTIHAIDAASGNERWQFVAGGRVDSPPTIHRGLALFGCADGMIYAVDTSDGALAWCFQAAPSGRKLMAYGQLESVWPVSGSVLVQGGRLYAVAGRSMFLDGGLRMVMLDPATGNLLAENVMDHRVPGDDGRELPDLMSGKHMPVAMPDILSSDGTHVYMKSQTFGLDGRRLRVKPQRPDTQYGDEVHLFAPISFLDDSWHQRTYWIYGRAAGEGWAEFQYPPKRVPCGRILCIDESNAYSYGRDPELLCNTSVSEYRLFCADRTPSRRVGVPKLEGKWEPSETPVTKQQKLVRNSVNWRQLAAQAPEKLSALDIRWLEENPSVMARGMVLAGSRLFVAGPRDVADEKALWGQSNAPEFRETMATQAAWNRGRHGSVLQVFDKTNGRKLGEMPLAEMPVFDGLIAAEGRLIMTTTDGAVICLR